MLRQWRLLLPLLIIATGLVGVRAFDLLYVVRRPSRNMWGFDIAPTTAASAPLPSYTLPLLELQAAAEAEAGAASMPLEFEPILPGSMYGLRSSAGGRAMGRGHLEQAVRRAVLSYGLFEVLGAGADAASVVAQYRPNGGSSSWRVGVVEMGAAGDGGVDVDLKEKLRRLLTTESGLDPATEVLNERVRPDLDLFLFRLPTDPSTNSSGRLLLCRRLAKGPAVGWGYTYAETPRRPRAGVLKLLAQERLVQQAFQTPTAMEPEIALAMATLARVGEKRGSKVLDPFVGGGSILVASGLLGAGEVVGTDAALELLGEGAATRAAAMEAFAALVEGPARRALMPDAGAGTPIPSSPKPPMLMAADIREFRKEEYKTTVFRRSYFDCIVTDPPYSIKERVRGLESSEREDVMQIIATLLEVAAHVLVPGGRLVFFLPVWGLHGMEAAGRKGRDTSRGSNSITLSSTSLVSSSELWVQWHGRILKEHAGLMDRLPSLGLKLVGAQPQIFTPTFFRWLVCIAKEEEEQEQDTTKQ